MIYLCGMSGPGSVEDLRELMEPIRDHFDGIIWVLHDSRGSLEDEYLASIGARIIHYYWHRRHDVSRNQYLWCSPLEDGDWIVDCDTLERIDIGFAANLKSLTSRLESANINAAFLYGKHFMSKYHESLRYQGSPHEGLIRDDGNMRAIDLKTYFSERESRYGVRHLKRPDPYHWVDHYASYSLYPFGSNHMLLGLENRGNPNVLFPRRESERLSFLAEMNRRGFARTLEGLKSMFSGPIDDTLRGFLNGDKVWNDFYRYHILNDKTVKDEHEWSSMITL